MPLESASYISDLEPSYPASTDLVGQADDHIRLLKSVLQSTFPNIDGPVTLSQAHLNASAPIGLISMWYGTAASVPAGWAICNGQTVAKTDGSGNITTPNLVDRFVVGAGTIAAEGATAGATSDTVDTVAGGGHGHTVTGGSHTHTGSVAGTALTEAQLPAHDHGLGTETTIVDGSGGKTITLPSTTGSTSEAYISDAGSGATHSHGLTIDDSGSHSHTVGDAADHTHSVTVDTVPPCMGLHYIMKV